MHVVILRGSNGTLGWQNRADRYAYRSAFPIVGLETVCIPDLMRNSGGM